MQSSWTAIGRGPYPLREEEESRMDKKRGNREEKSEERGEKREETTEKRIKNREEKKTRNSEQGNEETKRGKRWRGIARKANGHTSQACHAKAMRKPCENHAKNQRRAEKNEEHGRPLNVHEHRSLDR